ncbi:hypothetical protein LCGC14_2478210 [marine sediment metagenome]|uniref:Uncharacterized protein n=1 Tax=marine sediment metagenome TaxID=412755 RepID=A0A0F9B8A1_9ZZZZ
MSIELQKHSTFLCNPHVDGCECPDEEGLWCNPYSVEGYCPTEGKRDWCTRDPSRLIRVPTGNGGFTYALKEDD